MTLFITQARDAAFVSRPRALLPPLVLLYGVLLFVPIVNLVRLSLAGPTALGHHYASFFTDTFYLEVLTRTIQYAVATTVISLVIGYPLGYLMATSRRWLRVLITYAVLAPLLVSGVVRAFGWVIILDYGGLLSTALQSLGITDKAISLLYTTKGAIIGLTQLYMPFVVIAVAGAVQQCNFSVIKAAQSLGAGPITTFLRVFLPMTRTGTVAGAMLVFSLTASAFVIPTLVGGSRLPVIADILYKQGLLLGNWNFASAVAIVLLVFVAVINMLSTAYTK